MKIWVDADACPVAIKEILYRAANRTQIPLVLVITSYSIHYTKLYDFQSGRFAGGAGYSRENHANCLSVRRLRKPFLR